MRYQAIIEPPALDDLESCYLWIAERAPETALKWLDGFHAELASLATMPGRFGVAPENGCVNYTVRQCTYGRNRTRRYRALYTVVEDRVHILHIRGPGQSLLKRGEMREPHS